MRWILRCVFSLAVCALLLVGKTDGLPPPLVRVAIFPFGPTVMIAQYLTDAGLWGKWGERAGVVFEPVYVRDDFSQFSERKVDVVQLSPLEVARLKGDQGWEVVMWGRDGTASHGLYVRSDSKIGSIEELSGLTLAHPGFATGSTQLAEILFQDWWGLELGKDFQLINAPWAIVPELVAEGTAAGGLSLMPYTLNLWRDNAIRPLLVSYSSEWAKRRGTDHHLAMSVWASWKDWVEGHPDAARALLGAWAEGMTYAHTKTEEWAQKYLELTLPGAGEEEARFFAKWFKEQQPIYQTPYLDETFIEEEEAFLNLALKSEAIRSGGLKGIWQIIKPE